MKSWGILCVVACLGQIDHDGTQLLQSNSHHQKGRSLNEDFARMITAPDVVVKELLRDQSHAEALINRAIARDASQTIIANLLALPTERQSELVQFATSSSEAQELLDKLPVKTRDMLLLMVDGAMDKSVVDKGVRKKKKAAATTTTTTTTTKDHLTRTLGPWYMQKINLSDGVSVKRDDKDSWDVGEAQTWRMQKVRPSFQNIKMGLISGRAAKVDVNDSEYAIREGLWDEVGTLTHMNETTQSAAKKSKYAVRYAHAPYWTVTAEEVERIPKIIPDPSVFLDIPEMVGTGSLKTMGALFIDEVKENETRYNIDAEGLGKSYMTTVGRYPVAFGFVETCFDNQTTECQLPPVHDFSIEFDPAEEISVTEFEQCLSNIRNNNTSGITKGFWGDFTNNTHASEASSLLPGSKTVCWHGSCGGYGCVYFEMGATPTEFWASLQNNWPQRDEHSKYIKFPVRSLTSAEDKFSFWESVAQRTISEADAGIKTIKLN